MAGDGSHRRGARLHRRDRSGRSRLRRRPDSTARDSHLLRALRDPWTRRDRPAPHMPRQRARRHVHRPRQSIADADSRYRHDGRRSRGGTTRRVRRVAAAPARGRAPARIRDAGRLVDLPGLPLAQRPDCGGLLCVRKPVDPGRGGGGGRIGRIGRIGRHGHIWRIWRIGPIWHIGRIGPARWVTSHAGCCWQQQNWDIERRMASVGRHGVGAMPEFGPL